MRRGQAKMAAWVLLALFIVFPRLGKALGMPWLSLLGMAALDAWQARMSCPVLVLDSAATVEDNLAAALAALTKR